MQLNRSPKPENPRNIALTRMEALYEGLEQQGLTPAQIADQTGRSLPTVQNALFRAREKRRDMKNMKLAGL